MTVTSHGIQRTFKFNLAHRAVRPEQDKLIFILNNVTRISIHITDLTRYFYSISSTMPVRVPGFKPFTDDISTNLWSCNTPFNGTYLYLWPSIPNCSVHQIKLQLHSGLLLKLPTDFHGANLCNHHFIPYLESGYVVGNINTTLE